MNNRVSVDFGTPISSIRTLILLDCETIKSMPILPMSYKEKRTRLANDVCIFLNHIESHGFDSEVMPLIKSVACSFSAVHLAHLKLGVEVALAVLAFLSGVGEAILILIIILIVLEAIEAYVDHRDYNYLSIVFAGIPYLRYLKGVGPLLSQTTKLIKFPRRFPISSSNPFNRDAFEQILEQGTKPGVYGKEWHIIVDDVMSSLKKTMDNIIKDPRIQGVVEDTKNYIEIVQKRFGEKAIVKPNCITEGSKLYQGFNVSIEQLNKQLISAKSRLMKAEQTLSQWPNSQMAKDAVVERRIEVETIIRKIRQIQLGL